MRLPSDSGPSTGRRSDPASTGPASGWADTSVSVRLRRGADGGVRVDGVLCSAPVWFRWDGATLWLVGSGASPVGEDHVRVVVDVGPGVDVAVRSVAATVVYAARGAGTRWDTELHVAAGARLDWRPEPQVLTERARHATRTTVRAADGAEVTLDELLVLGRTDESPGALVATLDVAVAGVPTVLTSVDTTLPGWAGPGGIDGARVVGHRLRIGAAPVTGATTAPRAARLDPSPGCRLGLATGDEVDAVRAALDAVLPHRTD